MRKIKDISAAEEEYFDRVWYNRHKLFSEEEMRAKHSKDLVDGAIKAALEVEKKYGKENLGPYTDFEWGMVSGKLSALRWVLGDEWDMLDS